MLPCTVITEGESCNDTLAYTPPLIIICILICKFSPGLAAITKVIIAAEEKVIPANLHYKEPNPNIPALVDGRLEVVAENTTWNRGLVAVNSFGFGGTNVHTVLDTAVSNDKVNFRSHYHNKSGISNSDLCGKNALVLHVVFIR